MKEESRREESIVTQKGQWRAKRSQLCLLETQCSKLILQISGDISVIGEGSQHVSSKLPAHLSCARDR